MKRLKIIAGGNEKELRAFVVKGGEEPIVVLATNFMQATKIAVNCKMFVESIKEIWAKVYIQDEEDEE